MWADLAEGVLEEFASVVNTKASVQDWRGQKRTSDGVLIDTRRAFCFRGGDAAYMREWRARPGKRAKELANWKARRALIRKLRIGDKSPFNQKQMTAAQIEAKRRQLAFTPKQVEAIRAMTGTAYSIGKKLGINRTLVGKMLKGTYFRTFELREKYGKSTSPGDLPIRGIKTKELTFLQGTE